MQRRIAIALALTGAITLLYWIVFFAGAILPDDSECYMAWELSFPLADLWMSACSFVASFGLWRGSRWGTRWALIAAGALIFLALNDLLFGLENGLYLTPSGGPMVLIPLWTGLLGTYIIAALRGE